MSSCVGSTSFNKKPIARQYFKYVCAFAVIGLLLRCVLFYHYQKSPFLITLIQDSLRYWNWSDEIVNGNWWPGKVFQQGPLYPYFLFALKKLVQDISIAHVVIAQLVLNWLTCLLFYPALKWRLGEKAAAITTIIALHFAPAVFFSLEIGDTYGTCPRTINRCLNFSLQIRRAKSYL